MQQITSHRGRLVGARRCGLMPGRPGRSGGRNRKTAEQHEAEGTFQPVRHGKRPKSCELVATPVSSSIPEPAPGLKGLALAEWQRVTPLLTAPQLVDRAALTCYCMTWEELIQADAALAVNLQQALDTLALELPADADVHVRAQHQLSRRAAAQIVASGGRLVESDRGLGVHPAVRIAAAAEKRIREFSIEFFLTPLARNRMQASKPIGSGYGTPGEREAAAKRQERRALARKFGIQSAS